MSRTNSANSTRTGSSRQVIRKNGEVFAITHPAPPAIKDKQPACATTSSSHSQYVAPSSNNVAKKPLVPYHPLSNRNRIPVKFDTEPKNKCRFSGAHRNKTQFEIKDGSNVSAASRFRTTNKVTFNSSGEMTGFSNPGIVANKTQFLHTRQLD